MFCFPLCIISTAAFPHSFHSLSLQNQILLDCDIVTHLEAPLSAFELLTSVGGVAMLIDEYFLDSLQLSSSNFIK